MLNKISKLESLCRAMQAERQARKMIDTDSVGRLNKHYTSRREKTRFLHMRKQRRRSGNREADQRLCFRYTDSTIPLLPKSKILSLYPSSVAVQPGLCRTWSETLKIGFLTTASFVRLWIW